MFERITSMGIEIFGIDLIDPEDFVELILRFSLNALIVFVIIRYLYASNSKRKDFYFSYFAISITVFLICFLLENVKLELGFALGLFAIFGIIRYRTDAIPIKEMTYLFVVIGVSVINALANKKVSYTELLFTNAVIVAGLWGLERILLLKQENSLRIQYKNIENIKRSNEALLMEDLKERTGIDIERFEINRVDFVKDTADITVYYYVNGNTNSKN